MGLGAETSVIFCAFDIISIFKYNDDQHVVATVVPSPLNINL